MLPCEGVTVKVPVRELLRRPGRFAVAGVSLALLTVLLLLLGGLLDGLFLGSTGAIRIQDADVFVYSDDAQKSFLRSRVTPELRAQVEAVEGVEATGGLGVTLVAGHPGDAVAGHPGDAVAGHPGDGEELLDVAVLGYEKPAGPLGEPPAPGTAVADGALRAQGVEVGDVVAVGPTEIPLEVVGFVDDASYLLQQSLWVEPQTWRQVQADSRPDGAVGDEVFQVLLVEAADGSDAADLAARIDAATGATTSLTRDEAVLSLPGTAQQNATFTALLGTAFFVVGLITALFFVLLTVERTRLFAAIKALGVPSSRLVGWSVLQAVVVAAGAFVLGLAVTMPLAAGIPEEVPLRLEASRAVVTGIILVITAAVGSLLTLRRILRIDPASAIS